MPKVLSRLTGLPAPVNPADAARLQDAGGGGGGDDWAFVLIDTDIDGATVDLEPSILGNRIVLAATVNQTGWIVRARIGTVADDTDWTGVHIKYFSDGGHALDLLTATSTNVLWTSANPVDIIIDHADALRGIAGAPWFRHRFDHT